VLRSISRRHFGLAAAGATLLGALGAGQGHATQGGVAPAEAGRPKGLDRLAPGAGPLPELAFTDAEGAPRSLADFRGRPLLVNLWATWCPPCVAEMPALDRLQAALGSEGLVVLALSSDRGGKAQVAPFYARTGVNALGIWLDPRGAASRAVGARGLPTTLLVDRAGREVGRLEGEAAWDHPDWVARLRQLLLA
jgi:thiol-disulfide isomerase/thioredoxin